MLRGLIYTSALVALVGIVSTADAQQVTRRRAHVRDRIEDVRDRRENRRDRREDVRDRREDRRNAREDVRDARHNGGRLDRIEDQARPPRRMCATGARTGRDRREDRRDRREDRRDRVTR